MTHTKRILVGALALAFVSSTFASAATTGTAATSTGTTTATKVTLTAPTNLKMVKKADTSVSLEWDKVTGATSYTVKYGKKSVATSKDPLAQYEDETDPVTATGVVVEKLTPDTEYFFSVVSLDDKLNESDLFSNELAVKTDATGAVTASGATATLAATGATTPALTLATVNVVDNKTINLAFNNELAADQVTVKITKTSDNSDIATASVTPDVVDKKQVVVKLTGVLEPSAAYTLVVLAAKDANGANIQNGPDGLKEFTTDANLAVSTDALLTATGVTGSGAAAATELPKTGAREDIIVIVSLLLAGALVYAYRARKA